MLFRLKICFNLKNIVFFINFWMLVWLVGLVEQIKFKISDRWVSLVELREIMKFPLRTLLHLNQHRVWPSSKQKYAWINIDFTQALFFSSNRKIANDFGSMLKSSEILFKIIMPIFWIISLFLQKYGHRHLDENC